MKRLLLALALSSLLQGQVSLWHRYGTIITGNSGADQDSAQEGTLMYEGNAQILSGNVFKLWYTCSWSSGRICYAESKTAEAGTWTKYASNPVIASGHQRSFVFKNGSTYYMYAGESTNFATQPSPQFDQYTSSDGVNWTLAHSAVIVCNSSSQSWEYTPAGCGNIFVWIDSGGTWNALYESASSAVAYNIGLATSANGITWAKYSGNPLITSEPSCGGPELHQNGSLYHLWVQCSILSTASAPTDIFEFTSTDLHTWTEAAEVPLRRITSDEGPAVSGGQTADPSIIEVGGKTYMAYEGTTNGLLQSGLIHMKIAMINAPLATIMSGTDQDGEAAIDRFNRANGALGSNWNGSANIVVSGNAATDTAGGTTNDLTAYVGLPFLFDSFALARVTTLPSTGVWAAVCVRMNSTATNGYCYLHFQGGGRTVYRVTGGSFTILNANSGTNSVNDAIGIQAVGSTITTYVNGTLFQTVTDTTYPSGYPGIGFQSSNVATLDNFLSGQAVTSYDHAISGTTVSGVVLR